MHQESTPNTIDELRLAWMLAKRDLTNRYASSYAGFFWNIGVPLFNALIMSVIFSVLMGRNMGTEYADVPFVLFYFIPFSHWMLFTDVIGRSTGILKEYNYLISKIAFPYWVLPLVPFASALLSQAILLTLVVALAFYFNVSFASTIPMFVILWMISIFLTIGFAYIVSSTSVYFPDMAQIIPLCLNILFWLTPILYPSSYVNLHAPAWLKEVILTANPFYYISEYSRYALLSGAEIPIPNLMILAGVACIILLLGVFTFKKLKAGFADVV